MERAKKIPSNFTFQKKKKKEQHNFLKIMFKP
jgi:hypothetical protein